MIGYHPQDTWKINAGSVNKIISRRLRRLSFSTGAAVVAACSGVPEVREGFCNMNTPLVIRGASPEKLL
jgi:hypothetical protein